MLPGGYKALSYDATRVFASFSHFATVPERRPILDRLWASITKWLKEVLIDGITSNLTGMFDSTNQRIGEIAGNVGTTPQAWNGNVFSMIQHLSETVIVPIAGLILAFVMTLELIRLITEKNNLHDLDTWMFFKWAFKSAAAVLIVTNTWIIVMGVFDVAQNVVSHASGVIVGGYQHRHFLCGNRS